MTNRTIKTLTGIWKGGAAAALLLALGLPGEAADCRSNPAICDDGNACTDDICDQATGACSNPERANGASCDDGNAATVGDSCQASVSAYSPRGELIQGTDGAFYGTTAGGENSYGTVFKLNPNGSGFTVLKQFDSSIGISPEAGLIEGTDGALYGTAVGSGNGDGAVFKLNPDGSGFTVLAILDYFTDGFNPHARLIQGTDGALYGTTDLGGSKNYGTIFKLNPNGTGLTALIHLDGSTTGGNPKAGLIQGTDGALYGTTESGGSNGYGTIFKLNPNGTGFTVLKHLDGSTTGGNPYAGLIQGIDGALYGTTESGGSNTYGTIFKLKPNGAGFTVLKHLDGSTTGGNPFAGLMQGTDGALYGTSESGGSNGYGTIFKLNPKGAGFTVLENLDDSTTGIYPDAGLMQGTDGALYGTTGNGPSHNGGTIFRLNPDGTGFTVLANLSVSSDLTCIGTPDSPTCAGAYATPAVLKNSNGPNPPFVTVGINVAASAAITITGVHQDEMTSESKNDPHPDAQQVDNPNGTVQLRAECSSKGDGRVYRIDFTASSPQGSASCFVKVSVPQNNKPTVGDGGPLYDSTQ